MLSWRGFSDLWGQFLGPLIVVAIAVPVVGVVLRAAPLPRRTGALLHVLVIAVLVWLMLGGSPIHPVSSTHHLADRVADAWITAETYQPPIPSSLPSIAPLLIPCGALGPARGGPARLLAAAGPAGGSAPARGLLRARSASSAAACPGWSSCSPPAASC